MGLGSCCVAPVAVLLLERRDACVWALGLWKNSNAGGVQALGCSDTHFSAQEEGRKEFIYQPGLSHLGFKSGLALQQSCLEVADGCPTDICLLRQKPCTAETLLGNLHRRTCPRLTKQRRGAELTPLHGVVCITPVRTLPAASQCHLSL